VDREPAEIAHDPVSTELLGNYRGGPAAGKAVEDEVALVGRRADDPLQQALRLLGGVTRPLARHRVQRRKLGPHILNLRTSRLVEVVDARGYLAFPDHHSPFGLERTHFLLGEPPIALVPVVLVERAAAAGRQ